MDGLSAVSLNMGFVHVSTSAHLYLTEMRGGGGGGGGCTFNAPTPRKYPNDL